MNDRHPSGTGNTPASASDAASAQYASYGTGEAQYGDLTTYVGYDATGFSTGGSDSSAFDADPLFGSMPGHYTGTHEATGSYDATQWSTGGAQTLHYDAYAAQHQAAYDTGAYDTTTWTAGYQQPDSVPATGQWDTGSWSAPDQLGDPADGTQQWQWGTQTFETGAFETGTHDTGAFETSAFATGTFHTGAFAGGPLDTGAYDATQWNADGTVTSVVEDTARPAEHPAPDDAVPDAPTVAGDSGFAASAGSAESAPYDGELAATGELPTVTALLDDQEEVKIGRAHV